MLCPSWTDADLPFVVVILLLNVLFLSLLVIIIIIILYVFELVHLLYCQISILFLFQKSVLHKALSGKIVR